MRKIVTPRPATGSAGPPEALGVRPTYPVDAGSDCRSPDVPQAFPRRLRRADWRATGQSPPASGIHSRSASVLFYRRYFLANPGDDAAASNVHRPRRKVEIPRHGVNLLAFNDSPPEGPPRSLAEISLHPLRRPEKEIPAVFSVPFFV